MVEYTDWYWDISNFANVVYMHVVEMVLVCYSEIICMEKIKIQFVIQYTSVRQCASTLWSRLTCPLPMVLLLN